MTENTEAKAEKIKSREKESIKSETTEDGRYIPYSGGLMGWFENGGVLKCEEQNNYKFHTMVDANSLRKKLFERWGESDSVNRRISKRFAVSKEIHLSLSWEENNLKADTKDYSGHGLRLQIMMDYIDLSKGDQVRVQIFEDTQREKELFNLESQVMWITRVGRRRPVWNIGVSFGDMPHEDAVKLKGFLSQ